MGSLVPYFQYTRGHTFKATATPPSTLSLFVTPAPLPLPWAVWLWFLACCIPLVTLKRDGMRVMICW